MAAGKTDMRLLETELPELVLEIEAITLGIKSREDMKDSSLKQMEAKNVSRALCGLLNSGGGVIRAKIKNQEYDLNRDGIGQDLENSFSDILPFVQQCLDFKQDGDYFLIFVKSSSLSTCALPIATLATNVYIRSGASSVSMDAARTLEFLKDIKDTGGRLHLRAELPAEMSGDELQEECHVEDSAAAFFQRKELVHKEKFSFGESKHVEYKSFETKKLLQRIKEILPKTVSAFANTDGGYLFIGLRDSDQKVIGFEAEESECNNIEQRIKRYIDELPVYHFCKEEEKINYRCRFIKVHHPRGVCSHVFALRLERFCCAVFAKEPDSWHVEDNCVKPFTLEKWIEGLMNGRQD